MQIGNKSKKLRRLFFSLVIVGLTQIPNANAMLAFGVGAGGGGGLVNPVPLEMSAVRRAVSESRQTILYYLFENQKIFRGKIGEKVYFCDDPEEATPEKQRWCDASKKIFRSSPDILALLNDVKIEFSEIDSCYDAAGHTVDGSVSGQPTNQICISGKNLVEKLDTFFYEPQIAGLVLHEISHWLGSTEEEAAALQTDLINRLLDTSIPTLHKLVHEEMSAVAPLRGSIDFIRMGMRHPINELAALCSSDDFNSRSSKILAKLGKDTQMQFASDRNLIRTVSAMYEIVAISDYLCGKSAAAAVAQGRSDLVEKYKTHIEQAAKRYSLLKAKGTMPLIEYFSGDDEAGVSDLFKLRLARYGLEVPGNLMAFDDASLSQRILILEDEVIQLRKDYSEEVEGTFQFTAR